MKELDSSISDTRREYYTLKKEIEQIDGGELDSELPTMWEKVQTELTAKEGSESKGSRSRKSSTAAGSASAADGEHPKRQKSGGAERSREKTTSHKSPDKRSSQSGSEAHNTSLLPPVKEDKGAVVPASLLENVPLVSTPALTPSPSSSTTPGMLTPATQRSSSKKRNLESLPLLVSTSGSGGGGDLSIQEESPLLCPMTVPKEEQLRESIAASGGQLSRSLVLPLSPDMHVIVQQPNIAALSAGALPTSEPGGVREGGLPVHAPETKDWHQFLPPQIAVDSSVSPAAGVESVPQRPQPPGHSTEPAMVAVKQEPVSEVPPPLRSPIRPQTVAEALSSAATLPVHPLQLLIPPTVGSLPGQPLGLALQRAPLPSRPPPLHTPPPVLPRDTITLLPSAALPHHSPLKQTQSQPPPSSHDPQASLSAPMTVVSSVLCDPRLSSRPGPSRTTSTAAQPTLQQFLDKVKPPAGHQPDKGKSKSQSKSPENKGKNNPPMLTSQSTGGGKEMGKSKPLLASQSIGDKDKGMLHINTQQMEEKSKIKTQATATTTSENTQPLSKTPTTADKTKPLTQEATTTDNTKPPTLQTAADKAKSKPQSATTVETKLPTETEKKSKNTSGEIPSQPLTQLAGSRQLQDCLPQPTVDLVREPWKTDGSEPVKPGRVLPVIKTGEKTGEESGHTGAKAEESVAVGDSETVKRDVDKADGVGTGEEKRGEKEVEMDVVTTEEKEAKKGENVEAQANPPSSPHSVTGYSGTGTQKDSVEASVEGKQSDRDADGGGGGVTLDESMQIEAGSSRRSSISELPSSPLTSTTASGTREEVAPESEEILPRRRQPKPSSSKKLWPTRSRKRKLDVDESVESTDLESEEEPSSIVTSAAPSPAPSQSDGDPDSGMSKKQWKKAIMLVWRHAAQHKYANLFLHPVREDDAPGYKDVIHRPMDLSSIKRSIENGVVTTDIEFQRDMLLMFQNAFMYNSSDHDVYEMAEKMRADVMQSIQDYLSTQLQLIVESSTPKVLRSRDKEGRREGEVHDEGLLTPIKKRRTRADD
ncbi:Bromodomain-containing protein 8 [Geodia barretti]|nr:Bromodomain-containing protein 8 [Geodia barretti]